MSFSPLIKRLIRALTCLPGVGPKSAQRMALHLLEKDRDAGRALSSILARAMQDVTNCKRCRILAETEICDICSDVNRDPAILCVVESPGDVAAIEAAGSYRGLYFVLLGRLSPLDGVGPEDIGIDLLCDQLAKGRVSEIVLATNPTVEGETTAYYIAEIAKDSGIKVSRIAYGVPMGGELEYVDSGTLAKALTDRTTVI